MQKLFRIVVFILAVTIMACNRGALQQSSDTISEARNYSISAILADTLYETESMPLLHNISIKDSMGDVLFYDTTYFYTKKGLVRQIFYDDTIYHLLLELFDPIDSPQLLVLTYNKARCVDTTIIAMDTICDIDKDGFVEIISRGLVEVPCLDCDSCYYHPIYVYDCIDVLIFDSLLSRDITKQYYGCFLGFAAQDTILFCNPYNMDTIIKQYRTMHPSFLQQSHW